MRECGKCALESQHDGPCAYVHNDCDGRGCVACDGHGLMFEPDPLAEDDELWPATATPAGE